MKKTRNIKITKRKFINFNKNRKNEYFFCLPSFIISRKAIFEWGITQRIVCFGFGPFYIQMNIYSDLYKSEELLTKENIKILSDIFIEYNITITDKKKLKQFLEENDYILKIIISNKKNKTNLLGKLIASYFEKESFVKR